MATLGERLRAAREYAGHTSARDAAIHLNVAVSTYNSHERAGEPGSRNFSPEVGKGYARRFRVSFPWLMTGEGAMIDGTVIPVVGVISAGGEVDTEWENLSEPLFEVRMPFPLGEDAIGFEVRGNSMWPKYDPGDVIVVSKAGEPIESVLNFVAAVRIEDHGEGGGRYFKRVLPGAVQGLFDLESYNAPPMRGKRIAWCSGIITVVPQSRWKRLERKAVAVELRKVVKRAKKDRR